jgi:hypothetical protein
MSEGVSPTAAIEPAPETVQAQLVVAAATEWLRMYLP